MRLGLTNLLSSVIGPEFHLDEIRLHTTLTKLTNVQTLVLL